MRELPCRYLVATYTPISDSPFDEKNAYELTHYNLLGLHQSPRAVLEQLRPPEDKAYKRAKWRRGTRRVL